MLRRERLRRRAFGALWPACPGGAMAKRASAAKAAKKSDPVEINPGISAAGQWVVHRVGQPALAVNADQLDITDSGALIFIVGGAHTLPSLVVAADQYLY